MKLLALASLTLLSATSAHADQRIAPREIMGYAQIVAVEDNQMFPVRTITMTAMKPCGARVVGPIVNRVSANAVEVGVMIASHPGMMACLAMPVPVQVQASVYAETPVEIRVQNLRLDLNRDHE